MQTDDILFLASKGFTAQKDKKLKKTELIVKLQNELTVNLKLIFNKYVVSIDADKIIQLT
jgi:hypothetical protein